MILTGYECCFCKLSIDDNNIDPCDINIIINSEIKKSTHDRTSQNFYAHFNCLKARLHQDAQGYLALDVDENN